MVPEVASKIWQAVIATDDQAIKKKELWRGKKMTVDRLASLLNKFKLTNVTMVNNRVGRTRVTVAEASIWMHLTNCPDMCNSSGF